jgi:hypothetical protein
MPNDDDVVHNAYSFTGLNQFNLGLYAKGESRTVVFDHTGIVDVFLFHAPPDACTRLRRPYKIFCQWHAWPFF